MPSRSWRNLPNDVQRRIASYAIPVRRGRLSEASREHRAIGRRIAGLRARLSHPMSSSASAAIGRLIRKLESEQQALDRIMFPPTRNRARYGYGGGQVRYRGGRGRRR